jgi:ABC-type thiamin/hydroxymethylpyrimidine transport system permease subunit
MAPYEVQAFLSGREIYLQITWRGLKHMNNVLNLSTLHPMLIKTGLNNVVLPTLFTVVNSIVNNIVIPDSGSTISFNIVDKCEQCGQHNIL